MSVLFLEIKLVPSLLLCTIRVPLVLTILLSFKLLSLDIAFKILSASALEILLLNIVTVE